MLTGIIFEAYAPIGSPGRFFKVDGEPDVMEDPIIKEIAGKHNATPAQVLLLEGSVLFRGGNHGIPPPTCFPPP